MIRFCLDNLKNICWQLKTSEEVFGMVDRIAGTDEAIEASSWAEIASVGETFYGDGFEIEVKEYTPWPAE